MAALPSMPPDSDVKPQRLQSQRDPRQDKHSDPSRRQVRKPEPFGQQQQDARAFRLPDGSSMSTGAADLPPPLPLRVHMDTDTDRRQAGIAKLSEQWRPEKNGGQIP